MDMDISMDIHAKSVDMDMDMDGKFHIHGNPGHHTWSGFPKFGGGEVPHQMVRVLCESSDAWRRTVSLRGAPQRAGSVVKEPVDCETVHDFPDLVNSTEMYSSFSVNFRTALSAV